jgi:hypothetical protein
MRLKNYANFPDKKIREIFEFCAKPLGIESMTVVCEKRLTRMYGHLGYSKYNKKEIHIVIRDDNKLPYTNETFPCRLNVESRRFYPDHSELFLSKEECVLAAIAHELRHQWQKKRRPRSEWVYGSNNGRRTKLGDEIDTLAYEFKIVRQWRKLHSVDIYLEQPDRIPIVEENAAQEVIQRITVINK